MTYSISPIAHIKTDFPTKFGVPRQSGIVEGLSADIIFEHDFRSADFVRGIEDFSHLWLIWCFSDAVRNKYSPTVRPPRLGGNTKMGVFATRSPFRPNSLGLSSVKLEGVEHTENFGTVLHVSGADLKDGTPIFDIKPYLSFTDSHPDAVCGFAENTKSHRLTVNFPEKLLDLLPEGKRESAVEVLAHDPRPSYQEDRDREYGVPFAGYDIKFKVDGDILNVHQVDIAEN